MTFDDPRLLDGMRAQLQARDAAVGEGARQVGWKLGLGTTAAAEKFVLDRPLVGYLLDRGLLEDGAKVSVGGWTRPVLEPEVAVHIGSDVGPGASYDEVRAAVVGASVAVELVDLHRQPDRPEDVVGVLTGNIFHRHVLLGHLVPGCKSSAGLAATVTVDGMDAATAEDASAMTGDLLELVRLTAEQLAAVGERLAAGEVIITGSVVPPVPVTAGQRVEVEVATLGSLTISFR